MPRIANSLAVLRAQIDAAYPTRSKSSDGWIGDAAHAARKSDHNPNLVGVVQALDITHDPASGCDTYKLAETLRANRDPRIKYVISNGKIFSSLISPWEWRPYTGENAHAQHVHISADDDPSLYDNGATWNLSSKAATAKNALRNKMAQEIVNYEAQRDAQGRIKVYHPPANDGGGEYEVAGINVRFHAPMAARLKSLVDGGHHAEAEAAARDYVLSYTAPVTAWHENSGVEFYLRDCLFNRGPGGAVRILQRAVRVEDDGVIGPITRGAIAALPPDKLMTALRSGREDYERSVVGYRANFWNGLVSRWDKALVAARRFANEESNTQEQPPMAEATKIDINEFVTLLTAYAQGRVTIAPVTPVVPAPVAPPVAPPATTPILEKPGVGGGIFATLAVILGQIFGVLPPATGEAATAVGTALPILTAGVSALGATGWWGPVLSIAGSLLSRLTEKK